MWIGIKLIAEEDGEGGPEIKASDRLFAAIRTVIIADVVMSIDNVLGVAAAAKGSLLLLVFGLVVSVPLVIGGAQLIMRLIERFPILIVAGGGLLGLRRRRADRRGLGDHRLGARCMRHGSAWAAPIAGVVLVVGSAKWLQARQAQHATELTGAARYGRCNFCNRPAPKPGRSPLSVAPARH